MSAQNQLLQVQPQQGRFRPVRPLGSVSVAVRHFRVLFHRDADSFWLASAGNPPRVYWLHGGLHQTASAPADRQTCPAAAAWWWVCLVLVLRAFR